MRVTQFKYKRKTGSGLEEAYQKNHPDLTLFTLCVKVICGAFEQFLERLPAEHQSTQQHNNTSPILQPSSLIWYINKTVLMSRLYPYILCLCLSRDYLQSIRQLTELVCSKQLLEQHADFLGTQKMIIMMSTITLLQPMGITLTKRNYRKGLIHIW